MLLFHRAVERCVLAQLGRSVHAVPTDANTQVLGCARLCHKQTDNWADSRNNHLSARFAKLLARALCYLRCFQGFESQVVLFVRQDPREHTLGDDDELTDASRRASLRFFLSAVLAIWASSAAFRNISS